MMSRVAEGKFTDPSVENPIGEIIQLLSTSSDTQLFQEYGLWLARHEPIAAFSVCWSMSSQTLRSSLLTIAFIAQLFASPRPALTDPNFGGSKLEDLDILRVFQESSPLIAEQFLEYLVLNRNTPVSIFPCHITLGPCF